MAFCCIANWTLEVALFDAEAVEAVEAGIKPEVLAVDTLAAAVAAAAVDGGELWPLAGLGTNRPSPKYSYWENGRNLCLYSDLYSLEM